MASLVNIEGVGKKYAEKLAAAGVRTQEALLKVGFTPKGRKEIADKAGVSAKLIMEWLNRADLARIKGVGEEYADLLENSGVDTVKELAGRNAANLLEKMKEVNAKKKLVRGMPGLKQVEKWVAQAKKLPAGIKY